MISTIISHLHLFSDKIIEFRSPAAVSDVQSFEEKFKVQLPAEYKYLLSETNGLRLMGNEILGIYKDDQNIYDLNKAYNFEHFECSNPMPLKLIPFCPDGFGNHYCFDSNTNNIVFWQSDCDYTNDNPEIVYASLSEMIQEVFIDWTLEDTNYDGSDK